MGTRGLIGFRYKRKEYLTYNHLDSYFEELGKNIVLQIETMKKLGWEIVKERVSNLRLVKEEDKPTKKDKDHIKRFILIENKGNQSDDDWYFLLKGAEGSLRSYLRIGIMEDSSTFVNDSLFCEYAYIVNLDTMKFEIYVGLQRSPHKKGRYGKRQGGKKDSNFIPSYLGEKEFFPIALLQTYPLDNIPKNWIEDCENKRKRA